MKYLVLCDHHQAVIEQDSPEQAKCLFRCTRCKRDDMRVYQATQDDERLIEARR